MNRLWVIIIAIVAVALLAGCRSGPGPSHRESTDSHIEAGKVDKMNEQWIAAASDGDTDNVMRLLENGADVNATDGSGTTAVLAATRNGHTDTVRALIRSGADINIRDNRQDNVLLYAGASGYLDIVKLAIDAGADTALTNRFGGTALIPASERGHVEVVQTLLEQSDINVNHINNLQWTALLEAVILGNGGSKHQRIVQLLVDHGADTSIADRDGVTPLQHAQRRGYGEIATILKKAGATK